MKRLCLFCLLALYTVGVAQPPNAHLAGTTYSNFQHNGSCGRTIGIDGDGFIHMAWTRQHTRTPTGLRMVFYQILDPTTDSVFFGGLGGIQVNTGSRGGYVTLTVQPDGFGVPAFQDVMYPSQPLRAMAAFDFIGRLGAFTTTWPDPLLENGSPVPFGWPKIARSPDSTLHMLSMEGPTDGRAPRLFYSQGYPVYDEMGYGLEVGWRTIDSVQLVAFDSAWVEGHDIACSYTASRVARAWIRPAAAVWDSANHLNADIFLQVSEDGGTNWAPAQNITTFIQPDSACHRWTHNDLCCDKDTLRAYNDLSLLYDNTGQLHLAFTTVAYYQWLNGETGPFFKPNKAMIWHWTESSNEISLVAESWIEDSLLSETQRLLPYRSMVNRPSLSEDRTTGYIYCSYMKYDTADYSESGYLNAEVFVSVSTDHGASWSAGTNVTNTHPATVPAPASMNFNEQDATVADHVTNNKLHLFYLLDQDADVTALSNNPMYYQSVDVDSIAVWPLVHAASLHVSETVCDTINAATHDAPVTHQFRLSPAYPNPFNSTTVLRYELPKSGHVDLKVYDVLGREAAVLSDGVQNAGEHAAVWNAHGVSSGIYFVTLRASGKTLTQKIMLLK